MSSPSRLLRETVAAVRAELPEATVEGEARTPHQRVYISMPSGASRFLVLANTPSSAEQSIKDTMRKLRRMVRDGELA